MCSPMIRTINRSTKRPHQHDNFIAVLTRHIVSVRWVASFRSVFVCRMPIIVIQVIRNDYYSIISLYH